MSSVTFETSSSAETHRLGARLARVLRPGDVILLSGDLGAGKTVFTQGIGDGLHVREQVRSSSYVLVSEYHGRLTVYHADLYRLEDPSQVAELALEENAANGILVVEWPERAWQELPPEHLLVTLEWITSRVRRITLETIGDRQEPLVQALAASNRKRP